MSAVAEGTANGTVSVTTNGTTADVSVHGLDTAAYKAESYFEKAFTDGSHNVVTIGSYTPQIGESATQKIEFFDGTQNAGALGTAFSASDTIYVSEAVTAANPIITKNDISGITGAMVYKGVVNRNSDLPTSGVKAGWTYVVGTAGTYDGVACEVGDMIIAKDSTPTWNIINGENQVENKGATITAGAGTATDIAVVDGTTITANVSVTAGTATIASQNGNTITLKSGVAQSGTSGTIGNDTGSDITLADVAATGAANELTVTSAVYGTGAATANAQTALTNLASAITNSNITIDGHRGAITTGDGITAVTADGGSFALDLDSTNANGLYLNGGTAGSKKLAMHIADESTANGGNFGTVKVTQANGLTITSGVVAYAHNTTAITVARKDASDIITINGTLTPDAGDNIATSNAITLAKVAATGAAADVAVADAGGYFTGDTVEAALQQLGGIVNNGVKMWTVASPATSAGSDWTISITAANGFNALTDATVSVRDTSTGEEIECDKTLSGTTVKLKFSEAIISSQFTAVVTTKNTATNVA